MQRDAGEVELSVTLRHSGRRTAAVNGSTVRRQYELLGFLKAVQFSSLDLDLVRGSPAERRKWLDRLLVQLEPAYADLLDRYQKVLRQRNALLKEGRKPTPEKEPDARQAELAVWDAQLAATGTRILRRRARAIARLAPIARERHAIVSGDRETLSVTYVPNVGDIDAIAADPQELQRVFLDRIREKAVAEQYQGATLVGPHRDEIDLAIDGQPAKQFGSQGQQRTTVLA